MPSAPSVRGLHHVGLTVPDIRQAEAFFAAAFGCTRVAFEESPAVLDVQSAARLHARAGARFQAIALLRCGRGFIELFEYHDPEHARAIPLSSDPGGSHLAVEVEDITAAAEAVERAGARLCSGPNLARTPGFEGLTWLYAVTPWGQTIEIVQLAADARQLSP